jgi:hypothetical protein
MKDLLRFVALGASMTVSASLVAGCGSYDNGPKGTGGTTTTGGTGGSAAGTGGSAAGTGGSAAGTGGSAAGMGGSAGTGGNTAGTGGSAGMATGGSSGAGGDSMGGASGSGAGSAGTGAGGAGGGSGGSTQVDCMSAAPAPCGGDVVGTWTSGGCDMTVSGMANLTSAGIGCTAAPAEGKIKVTGTFTATADGMFMDNTTTTGEVIMELAAQCLMISGFMGTCDRLDLEPAGLSGIMCVDNEMTMGCTCTVPIDQMGGLGAITLDGFLKNKLAGTYTAMDNKLVLTAGEPTEYSYCVAGSTLTIEPGIPTNVGTVTGPMVLQKQ